MVFSRQLVWAPTYLLCFFSRIVECYPQSSWTTVLNSACAGEIALGDFCNTEESKRKTHNKENCSLRVTQAIGDLSEMPLYGKCDKAVDWKKN